MEDAEADNEEVEADATETEAAEEAESSGEGKTGWAEKRAAKKQAKQKEEAYKEQIAQLEDKVMRQMAEFENFRKRTEKEKQAMFETGAKSIIEKILPVVDNFERGLAAVPEAEKGGAFAQGMEMIYKQFIKCLEDAGVTAIEAIGKEFDPNLHNAVMHVEDESLGENEIVEVFQKGYKKDNKIIRFAMVKTAN